jgi:hypothetical protein
MSALTVLPVCLAKADYSLTVYRDMNVAVMKEMFWFLLNDTASDEDDLKFHIAHTVS